MPPETAEIDAPPARPRRGLASVEGRLALALTVAAALGGGLALLLDALLGHAARALALTLAAAALGAALLAPRLLRPLRRLLRALEGALASYRDGDFSFSIPVTRRDALGQLVDAHNRLAQTLREQRQHLVQRELLLDTVVQNTPVALLLVDAGGRIAYANLAARQLFNDNRSLAGLAFETLLSGSPEALREAVADGGDALFAVTLDGAEETFHLSQRGFRLQGRPHRLYLFRRMTRELSRQEVATWKKVIRVMSHEINNSLAPISSMAHSGAQLLRRGETARLPEVLTAIGARARHLHGFIDGYARFARLPAPRIETVSWPAFIAALRPQAAFALAGTLPEAPARFDPAQIEQVLINLLKNAHEAGGDPEAVSLAVDRVAAYWRIEVADRGAGMSETVLANALLPFYSTKRAGTGLGLALTREIVEAHGGRVQLANREGGGLRVTLQLPA